MIAPHLLILSIIFSIGWGWHLVDEIHDWRELRVSPTRTKAQVGSSLRSLLAAFCLESLCLAYLIRTGAVVAGFGDVVAAQIVVFAVLGINIPGFLFAIISRKLD